MMNRRHFLKTAGTGLGLLVLPRWARGAAPSDTIVTGHIGVGGMGNSHVGWFLSHRDVRIDAICDVDRQHRDRTLQRVHAHYGNQAAKGYGDFREVLDRPDIDAISCATPDHWHALVACSAFQAGKDVYSEKPLAHNYREAEAMLRSGQRYGRVFQLGTQIHADDNYHRVVEIVRSGELGRIHTLRVWMGGGCPSTPFPPPEMPPADFDYEAWLGPAPWRPYHRCHVHFNFRYYLDFSTGAYADFWCHISDIAFWAAEPGVPRTITARGAQHPGSYADAPAWIEVDFEFPELTYHWTTRAPDVPGAEGRGMACCFEGTRGSLVCDYGSRDIFLDGPRHDIPEVPQTIPRSGNHQRNFLDCVKSRNLTESNLPYVVNMTAPMFFGRISWLLRRPLTWDPVKEEFTGDDEATRLLGRVYRAPWELSM